MNTIVYLETKEGKPLGGSLELLTPAAALGTVTAVVAGVSPEVAQEAAGYGAPVLLLEGELGCDDALVAALEQVIREKHPDLVLFAATQTGKDLAPRLAQRFGSGCVTDATAVEGDETHKVVFTRPAYGGTILEKLALTGEGPMFANVRTGSYSRPQTRAAAPVETMAAAVAEDAVRAKLVETVTEITELVNLEGADVIVAGGRGMVDAEGFKLVEELAQVLGGVVGASRPAIEAGWVSRAHQIGQSGKIVAPKLYIACSISGAMQHISGALGSKYIVAINKDEDASIFDVADVGIVGDVKEILPLMIQEIRKKNG